MKNSSKKMFGASANKPRQSSEFDLRTANTMLPLVKSIAKDLVGAKGRRATVEKELTVLEEYRRDLTWESRKRRYQLMDELGTIEQQVQSAVQELKSLGLKCETELGLDISFPTRINDRPAVFSWRDPEENVMFWHYAGEESRRNVPAEWLRKSGMGPI